MPNALSAKTRFRSTSVWMVSLSVLWLTTFCASVVQADEINGIYLEARTCQVYTGPCFAAGEVGLAGKQAVLGWKIQTGKINHIDLSGLSVVVVLRTQQTLGFEGIVANQGLRSLLIVDERATKEQCQSLIEFIKLVHPAIGNSICGIRSTDIELTLDLESLRGNLKAGKLVNLSTRKANPDDCICSNESAYYPPLAPVENFVPGVALKFSARGPNCSWETADTRNSYMATFRIPQAPLKLTGS